MGKSKKNARKKLTEVSPTEEGRKMREAVLKEAASSQRSCITADAASSKSKNSLEAGILLTSSDSEHSVKDVQQHRLNLPKIRRRKTRHERNIGRSKTTKTKCNIESKEKNDFVKQLRHAEDIITRGRVVMERAPIMSKLGTNRLTADSSTVARGEDDGILKRVSTRRASPAPLQDASNTTRARIHMALRARPSAAVNQSVACAPSPMDMENMAAYTTPTSDFPQSPNMVGIAKLLISSCNLQKHFPDKDLCHKTKKELCKLLEDSSSMVAAYVTPRAPSSACSAASAHLLSARVTSSGHMTSLNRITPSARATPSSAHSVPRGQAHRPPRSAGRQFPPNSLHGCVSSEIVYRQDMAAESRQHVTADSRKHMTTDSRHHVTTDSRQHVTTESRQQVTAETRQHVMADSRQHLAPESRQRIASDTRDEAVDAFAMDTGDAQGSIVEKLSQEVEEHMDGDANFCAASLVMSPKTLLAINEKNVAAKEWEATQHRQPAPPASHQQPCFPSHHQHQRSNTQPLYFFPAVSGYNSVHLPRSHLRTKSSSDVMFTSHSGHQSQFGPGLPARLSGRQYILGSDGRLHMPLTSNLTREHVTGARYHVSGTGDHDALHTAGKRFADGLHVAEDHGGLHVSTTADAFLHQYNAHHAPTVTQPKVTVEYLHQRPTYAPAATGHGDTASSRTQEVDTNMDIIDYLDFGLRNEPMNEAQTVSSRPHLLKSTEIDNFQLHPQLLPSSEPTKLQQETVNTLSTRDRFRIRQETMTSEANGRALDWIERHHGQDPDSPGIPMRPHRLF